MAVIHMNVESVREVQSQMKTKHQELSSNLSNLTSQINQTIGNEWTGPASAEFEQTYQELYAQFKQQLEVLEGLIQELDYEIIQWEEITARIR